MPWQTLRARLTGVEEEPFDDVPEHLRTLLRQWVRKVVGAPVLPEPLEDLCAMLRIPISREDAGLVPLRDVVVAFAEQDDEQLLAVVDALLSAVLHGGDRDVRRLERLLSLGNSVWTVPTDGTGLTRRMDPSATAELDDAIAPRDAAARELAEARRAAFGPDPDASDAWDHAIKAVEHVLTPIVCDDDRATLGRIRRELVSRPDRYTFVLPGKDGDHGVAPLVAMLELLWPNPDRHGGESYRVPELDEAKAVVHLAVTVVQWGRQPGALVRGPRR